MPQETARLKLYLWLATAMVISLVFLAMVLILWGFRDSQQRSDNLRLLLCDTDALRTSRYCEVVKETAKPD